MKCYFCGKDEKDHFDGGYCLPRIDGVKPVGKYQRKFFHLPEESMPKMLVVCGAGAFIHVDRTPKKLLRKLPDYYGTANMPYTIEQTQPKDLELFENRGYLE